LVIVQKLLKAACGTTALTLMGCYTLQPVTSASPAIGERIAFDVNDMGRAALGGSMGPEIGQIEGRLVQKDTTQYVVAVSSIRLLRGGEQTWSGEQVHIKSDYVTTTYARHFAKGRTIALSAVGIGALAFLVTRSLTATGDADVKVPGDSSSTMVSPRP
jgi:hypothetical protein